ncbi:AlkA N-terminal domain-containing protein [Ramlibacter sp. AN1015]|uniref:DNA-3-methyladenine glycosylase 2 family protein n=1 Tax=Ramlibacter sp. AN1015 TaxID=3133428 RepID=UPI0030C4B01D
MAPLTDDLQPDACWHALRSRDARFDGCFFTAVTSTGIYCRPVCRARTPRRENCRFFRHAAQAERAGFRPCLRCRPELAPQALWWSSQDAPAILAREAARLLDQPEALSGGGGMPALAARLGVSDRHLRRVFEAELGVSPLQYLQTRRLLTAKQLLADTRLPVTQVAALSGFASLRRFNAAFVQHYGLNPTQLRREGHAPEPACGAAVRLGLRPPYDVRAMLAFFARRAIDGVERVDADAGLLARTLAVQAQGRVHAGWFEARFVPERHLLLLRVADALTPVLPQLIARVRATFDLDADPQAISAVLAADFPDSDGLRVPGGPCGFELAVRAVLGQQVTVAAARTLAARLVEHFGEPLPTPLAGVQRLFPAAPVLAGVPAEALGALGIVRQRQAAILALAQAVAQERLVLSAAAPREATLAQLQAMPGIGAWTAQYLAMRVLRWPDAFPAGDVALQQALGVRDAPHPARAATARAEAWRPWRSYAVLRAWAGRARPTGDLAAPGAADALAAAGPIAAAPAPAPAPAPAAVRIQAP